MWLPSDFHIIVTHSRYSKCGIREHTHLGSSDRTDACTDQNCSLHCHLCGTRNATACEHYCSVPRSRIFLHQAWNNKKQETMLCSYLWLNSLCDHYGKHTGMDGMPVLLVQKYEEIYNFKNSNYSNLQWHENTGEETDTLQFITPHTRSVRKVSDRIFLCEHLMDYSLARWHEPTLNLSAHA
jgi:hypothetical protein